MAYYRNRFHRPAKPQMRVIVVKYAGKCACCGAPIKAGEMAEYYPARQDRGETVGRIGHIGGLDGTSARCSVEIAKTYEARAVNDYAGDGLDARWEDDGAAICGR